MNFSQGELLFYGGIVSLGVLIILSIIIIFVIKRWKKKILERIENEY